MEVTVELFAGQANTAILGVADGFTSRGVEDEAGIAWRKQFLRQIGYKLA